MSLLPPLFLPIFFCYKLQEKKKEENQGETLSENNGPKQLRLVCWGMGVLSPMHGAG